MDDLSEDDNEPAKIVSSTETQEMKAEVTKRESLDNATKLQTDNSEWNFDFEPIDKISQMCA
jgi:hypothetical protein